MDIYIYIYSKNIYCLLFFTVPTTVTNVITSEHKFTLANRDPSSNQSASNISRQMRSDK